jgi:hypothetical protein
MGGNRSVTFAIILNLTRKADDDAAFHQRSPPKLSQATDDFSPHHQPPQLRVHWLITSESTEFSIARRSPVKALRVDEVGAQAKGRW